MRDFDSSHYTQRNVRLISLQLHLIADLSLLISTNQRPGFNVDTLFGFIFHITGALLAHIIGWCVNTSLAMALVLALAPTYPLIQSTGVGVCYKRQVTPIANVASNQYSGVPLIEIITYQTSCLCVL